LSNQIGPTPGRGTRLGIRGLFVVTDVPGALMTSERPQPAPTSARPPARTEVPTGWMAQKCQSPRAGSTPRIGPGGRATARIARRSVPRLTHHDARG
jgi:hypothetical protein